jgi:DNA-binding transcriptional MocR family regulator
VSTKVPRPASLCPDPLRYTRLPDALISELTPREHQLVHALLSYRWTDDAAIYPSVPTLAKRLRCTDRTIQRTLRSLERQGYLVTVARFRDEGDHGQTSNTYAPGPMLLPLLPPAGDRDVAGPGDTHGGQTRTPEKYNKRSGGTGHKRSVAASDYARAPEGGGSYMLRDGRMVLVPHD